MNTKLIEFIDVKSHLNDNDKAYWIGVISQLLENIPCLTQGQHYTLSAMFCDDYWEDTVADNYSYCGQLVSQMVYKQLLPLVHSEKNGSNAHQYQLIKIN
jgi:hypothetical protein